MQAEEKRSYRTVVVDVDRHRVVARWLAAPWQRCAGQACRAVPAQRLRTHGSA